MDEPGDEPLPEKGLVDIAVLDMHHGYANLGHASIVESLLNYAHEARQKLPRAPAVRVVSYDVRLGLAIPSFPARFPIGVGSGGPGALDPRENDGVSVMLKPPYPVSKAGFVPSSFKPLRWTRNIETGVPSFEG